MSRRGVFFVLLSSLLLPTLSLGLGSKKKKKKKRRRRKTTQEFQRRCWRVVCARVTGVCADGFVCKQEFCLNWLLFREGRRLPSDDRIISSQLDKESLKQFFFFLPTGWYYGPRCYCAFVVCKCNFLPRCDDRYIFYKDIHICMWVSVSMLNPPVLLCEPPHSPRFKAAILGSFSRQHFLFCLFFTVDFV